MVRLAFVITDLSYGGAQTMLLQLIKEIDREKYKVAVFVREHRLGTGIEREIDELGVECHFMNLNDTSYIGSKLVHKIKAQRVVNSALSKFKPNIVHSHLESSYSLLFCLMHSVSCIFTIHSFPDRIFTKQFLLLQKLLFRRGLITLVGCAKCVSDRAKELLGEKYNESVCTIYNPIELDHYYKDIHNNDKFNFVNVARMNPIKNHSLLLEAFAIVNKKYKNTKLLLAGDGELWNALHDETERLGIASDVVFLGNRTDIPDILAKSDVFVLTSKSECCPMTVLEAMATGLPIISTDVGGVREIINSNGILVDNGDVSGIAKAMESLIKDAKKRNELAETGKRIVTRYEAGLIANEYVKIYNCILN